MISCFPLIFRPLKKPDDILPVTVEDQGSDDDAQNKVGLRITPEKSNENGDR